MLALAFFVSVFSTVTWLIYAFLFVSEKLSGIPLNALSLFDASIYAAFMILPVFVLWSIFGYINQYTTNRHILSNMLSLFKQMKKNMDYTDLVARIMLEAEQEIKDGFILNKFDIFIADMNELLAEIIRRTGIASTEQIESLWAKVQNGGKWSFGKVLIEVSQNQEDFQMRVFNRAQQDIVLAGSILEFTARYQSLVNLLEKHDKEHVFLNLIETGVFGKVYSIMEPVAVEVQKAKDAKPAERVKPNFPKIEQETVGFFQKEESSENLFADKDEIATTSKSTSLMSKFNLFRKKNKEDRKANEEDDDENTATQDPFTMALERSFGANDKAEPVREEPRFLQKKEASYLSEENKAEPWHDDKQLDIEDFTGHVNNIETPKAKDFLETNKTLKSLRQEWEKMKASEQAAQTEKKAVNGDNVVYPFSSWVDEVGSKK